jgi:hypothetical protein
MGSIALETTMMKKLGWVVPTVLNILAVISLAVLVGSTPDTITPVSPTPFPSPTLAISCPKMGIYAGGHFVEYDEDCNRDGEGDGLGLNEGEMEKWCSPTFEVPRWNILAIECKQGGWNDDEPVEVKSPIIV